MFEELDNLSDSGPEMVMDNLSIISNPRPSLQPYFASREVLPISDNKVLVYFSHYPLHLLYFGKYCSLSFENDKRISLQDNIEETDSDEEVSSDVDDV